MSARDSVLMFASSTPYRSRDLPLGIVVLRGVRAALTLALCGGDDDLDRLFKYLVRWKLVARQPDFELFQLDAKLCRELLATSYYSLGLLEDARRNPFKVALTWGGGYVARRSLEAWLPTIVGPCRQVGYPNKRVRNFPRRYAYLGGGSRRSARCSELKGSTRGESPRFSENTKGRHRRPFAWYCVLLRR